MKSNLVLTIILLFQFNFIQSQSWEKLPGPNWASHSESFITSKGNIFIYTDQNEFFYSEDDGRNWKNITKGTIFNSCNYITIFRESTKGEIYLLYQCKFYKYNELESKWDLLHTNTPFIEFNVLDDRIFAVTKEGLYVSTTEGKTFILLKKQDIQFSILSLFGNNINFIRTSNFSTTNTFLFDDDGNNIQEIPGFTPNDIQYDKAQELLLYSSNNRLFWSKDFGRTGLEITDTILSQSFNGSIIKLSNNNLLLNTSKGLFRSFNFGKSWVPDESYIFPSNLTQIKISISRNDIILLTFNSLSILLTSDKNVDFLKVNSSTTNSYRFFETKAGNIICRSSGRWYLSRDLGKTWEDILRNMAAPIRIQELNFLQFSNSILLAHNSPNLYLSEDMGESWIERKLPISIPSFSKILIGNNDKMYLLSSNGSVFESSDYGQNWFLIPNNRPTLRIHPISFNISRNGDLYFMNSDSVFYSKASPINWNGFQITRTFDQKITLNDNNKFIWIGSSIISSTQHIYYTSDYGRQIDSININSTAFNIGEDNYVSAKIENTNGITVFDLNSISSHFIRFDIDSKLKIGNPNFVFRTNDGYLYLGRFNDGIYKTKNQFAHMNNLTQSTIPYKINYNCLTRQFKVKKIEDNKKTYLKLINLWGKIILSTDFQECEYEFETSSLSQGIYILLLQSHYEKQYSFKFYN